MSDITYARPAEARLYVCAVLEFYSKRVVGWSMRRTPNRDLVLKAATMALYRRETSDEPVVLHSDRGTKFTRREYQTFL